MPNKSATQFKPKNTTNSAKTRSAPKTQALMEKNTLRSKNLRTDPKTRAVNHGDIEPRKLTRIRQGRKAIESIMIDVLHQLTQSKFVVMIVHLSA